MAMMMMIKVVMKVAMLIMTSTTMIFTDRYTKVKKLCRNHNCPQDYQYMFGDDLLVAPVLEPGLTAWRVYLPGPETWVRTCSSETYIQHIILLGHLD